MPITNAVNRSDSHQEPDAKTGANAVPDAGYESDVSANSHAPHASTEARDRAFGKSEGHGNDSDPLRNLRFSGPSIKHADTQEDVAPPLPRKQNREALIANVEKARRALQDPSLQSAVTQAPVPKPRYHLTGTSPVRPERTFTFDASAANRRRDSDVSTASHTSDGSDGSHSSGESTLVGSQVSLASMQARMRLSRTESLTSIASESSTSSGSSTSSTSSFVDELKRSPWAKDSLIENMLRTQGL